MKSIDLVRRSISNALKDWGLVQQRAVQPFSYSGGRTMVWSAPFRCGEVIVREESYRQHAPRLQLDIGVRIFHLDAVIDMVRSKLTPWGRCDWYPHFQFGWTLGQCSPAQLEQLRRRVDPIEEGNNADVDVANLVFAMEGFKGGIMFADDIDAVVSELDAAKLVVKEAFCVFADSASTGILSSTILENRFRFCPHYSWSVAMAVGYAVRGECERAVGALDLHESLLMAKGNRKPVVNHEQVRELIPVIAEMARSAHAADC